MPKHPSKSLKFPGFLTSGGNLNKLVIFGVRDSFGMVEMKSVSRFCS